MTPPAPIDRLEIAKAHGLFAIHSTSETVYFYDADSRELLRAPGRASATGTGPYDNCWTHLVAVSSAQDTGVITVGRRHRWDLDPNPGQPGLAIWWLQRMASSIDRIPREDRPIGRIPEANEENVPFTLRPPKTVNATNRATAPTGKPDPEPS